MHSQVERTPLIQLAPMEGVLDWVLREQLADIGGFDRMVTEFVRVTDRVLPPHVFHKYSPELANGGKTRSGVPVFIQLLGGQPGPMAENAAVAASLGAPGIDINFGCPAKTVNRHDGGAALLSAPRRLYDVTHAIRQAVPKEIPVTAKVRLGLENKDFHREIAQAVEEGGAAHIVVHARTKREMYTPPAHWEYIARMREGRKIPFLANGEIWSVEDYRRCRELSGVTAVALGRGVVRRPTLACEIRHEILGSTGLPKLNKVEFLQKFFTDTSQFRGGHYAVARLKQVLRYWSAADSQGMAWFNEVKRFTQSVDVESFLSRIEKENLWPKSKSTPGPIVPSAFVQKTC